MLDPLRSADRPQSRFLNAHKSFSMPNEWDEIIERGQCVMPEEDVTVEANAVEAIVLKYNDILIRTYRMKSLSDENGRILQSDPSEAYASLIASKRTHFGIEVFHSGACIIGRDEGTASKDVWTLEFIHA